MKRFTPWLQVLGIGVFLLCLQLLSVFAASNVRLYLNPAATSVKLGQTFTVDVRLGAQDAYYIGYVKADLTFSRDIIRVDKIDSSQSDFDTTKSQVHNNAQGTITIERTGTPYATGDKLVSRITFRTVRTGNASVQFASTSQASYYSYSNNMLTSTAGGSYVVNSSSYTPPPTPPPTNTPPPTPPPTITPKPPTTAPNSALSTSKPSSPSSSDDPSITSSDGVAITDLSTININFTQADIVWHTTLPSTAVINYGTDQSQLNDTQSVTSPETDFRVTPANLVPGKRYFFSIVVTADGSKQNTATGEFITLGYPIEILVVGAGQKPIPNAEVTAGGVTQKTTDSGKTKFYSSAGRLTLKVKVNKITKEFPVEVKAQPLNGSEPAIQTLKVQMPISQKSSAGKFVTVIIILLLIGGLTGTLLLLHSRNLLPVHLLPTLLKRKSKIPVASREPSVKAAAPTAAGAIAGHVPPVPQPVPPASALPLPPAQKPDTSYHTVAQPMHAPPVPQPATHHVQPTPAAKAPPPPPVQVKPVEAYKDNGEPKDIFEIAEERFEQDDRLKKFREKP
jgi:hypothetical protein